MKITLEDFNISYYICWVVHNYANEKAMGKISTNKLYDAQRALLVKRVAAKFGVSESYTRMCISGTAKSLNAENIARHYNKLRTQLEKLLS